MGDLDKFKQVNDTYGHPAGDEVLRSTAKALRESVRRYDSVGRYGGEEFLIVLPGCDTSNALGHAERLRTAIARLEVEIPGGTIRPTVSIGVTVFNKGTDADALAVIQAADLALYRAKHAGRNRVEAAADCEFEAV
jgi:diguanylate cyclase (GGDEF)-like protein